MGDPGCDCGMEIDLDVIRNLPNHVILAIGKDNLYAINPEYGQRQSTVCNLVFRLNQLTQNGSRLI